MSHEETMSRGRRAVERAQPGKPPLSMVRRIISSLRLFPKTPDFFSYFERSSENIVRGTELLCRMVKNQADRHALVEQLKDIEHVGDHITHEVIDLLHTTFLTPFDRMDIHALAVKMDDVLDIAFYVGNRMTRYNITSMPSELGDLAEILHRSSVEINKAMPHLRHMKNSPLILEHCIEINRLENEADEKVNAVIESLFTNGYTPYDLIKIKELVENLEAAADKCEDVANLMEGIILRNA